MDPIDRRILMQLQTDATLSHAQIAEIVHLSASQVSRRITRLHADGVIRQQVALLDEDTLGLHVEAYVTLTMASYASDIVRGFHDRISGIDSVLDCCATTGTSDYQLRVVARTLHDLSVLINRDLLGHGDVASVRSSVVLDHIKRTTALPISQPDKS